VYVMSANSVHVDPCLTALATCCCRNQVSSTCTWAENCLRQRGAAFAVGGWLCCKGCVLARDDAKRRLSQYPELCRNARHTQSLGHRATQQTNSDKF
jgi:hypothetical protein